MFTIYIYIYIKNKDVYLGISVFFPPDYMWGLVPDVVMVIISEVAVDVVKHAFITKFNDISADVRTLPLPTFSKVLINQLMFSYFLSLCSPVLCLSQVYSEYRASLAFDLVSSRQKNVRSCLLSVYKHFIL